jgi:NTP pyrophosphatase (non-canonical NTP hydrolase)
MMNLNDLAQQIYIANKDKGFWDKERNVGEVLMLIVSELGEALEAHRKNRVADWDAFENQNITFAVAIKDSFEDELADAVIRILDYCGGTGIDIQRHIAEKLAYNATRERLHGKNY